MCDSIVDTISIVPDINVDKDEYMCDSIVDTIPIVPDINVDKNE